jgi:hypothetical protein
MKKIIIVLCVLLLGATSTGRATPINPRGIHANYNFWESAFLNAGANYFHWNLDMKNTTWQANSPIAKTKNGMALVLRTTFLGYDYPAAIIAAGTSIGNDAASPIPEPAAMLLFGTGLAGLAVATRRKLFHRK